MRKVGKREGKKMFPLLICVKQILYNWGPCAKDLIIFDGKCIHESRKSENINKVGKSDKIRGKVILNFH